MMIHGDADGGWDKQQAIGRWRPFWVSVLLSVHGIIGDMISMIRDGATIYRIRILFLYLWGYHM